MNNPYEVLGVRKNSSPEGIKKRYRHLTLTHHPDCAGDQYDAAMWHQIQEAYEILSDPVKRKMFDETGMVDDSLPADMTLGEMRLMELFIAHLQKHVTENKEFDFKFCMKQLLVMERGNAQNNINTIKEEVVRLEKFSKRVKRRTKDKPNFLLGKTLQIIGGSKEEIQKHEQTIATVTEALAILEDFDITPPIPECDGFHLGLRTYTVRLTNADYGT